jgi:hypothetical protein
VGVAASDEPPELPRASAEGCTAVALQGGYLVCAFSVTLGRSKVSFKSRRSKEVRTGRSNSLGFSCFLRLPSASL